MGLDIADKSKDKDLATHILHVHMHSQAPALDFEPLTSAVVRSFVSRARLVEPAVPASLTAFISDLYVNERKKDKEAGEDSAQVYASARTLLSILRLATACARIRFSPAVSKEDVMESMRL